MSMLSTWRGYAPGLIAVTLLAWASIELHTLPQLAAVSALMIAIVLGMLLRNTVGLPAACAPGIRFSLRRILRFAIVLLGFQLSARQIAEVGGMGLFVVVVTLAVAFCFTKMARPAAGSGSKALELDCGGDIDLRRVRHCGHQRSDGRQRRRCRLRHRSGDVVRLRFHAALSGGRCVDAYAGAGVWFVGRSVHS